MSTEKYNGWENRETWLVGLWYPDFWSEQAQQCWDDAEECKYLSRDENARMALAEIIEQDIREFNEPDEATFLSDLIGGCLGRINYQEIAEGYIDEVDKEETE